MITLPCEPPSGATVATIFGDDIDGVYGKSADWYALAYDPGANGGAGDYVPLAETDAMNAGRGYWIIQATGETATLSLPPGSRVVPVDPQAGAACQSPGGCRTLRLSGLENEEVKWNFLGNPSPSPSGVRFDDLRVQTPSGACSATAGCSMAEAAEADVVFDEFYQYDSASERYDEIGSEGNIDIWKGYWVPELPRAEGNAPLLVFPAESPPN